jgi:hypothetical protein
MRKTKRARRSFEEFSTMILLAVLDWLRYWRADEVIE